MAEKRKKCEQLVENCRTEGCGRWFRYDERYLECPECGASRICGADRQTGSRYCRIHTDRTHRKGKGGDIMTGATSQSTLTRLSSKYSKLATDYRRVVKSGLYLSNQGAIAFVDEQIVELIEIMAKYESPQRIASLINGWNAFKAATKFLMPDIMADKNAFKAYNAMEEAVNREYHGYMAREQVFRALELRGKLSSQEAKIWKDANAVMSAKDVMEFGAQLLAANIDVLREHPDGQQLIAEIRHRFAVITGEADIDNYEGGGEEVIDIDPQPVDRESFLYPGNTERPETEGEDTSGSVPEGLPE